jgi:hypothetical protein
LGCVLGWEGDAGDGFWVVSKTLSWRIEKRGLDYVDAGRYCWKDLSWTRPVGKYAKDSRECTSAGGAHLR